GKGTRFTLKVPLTLAILDGLGLRVGDEQYIVPLTAVLEAFRLSDLLRTSPLERGEVVNVRGRFIPLLRLRRFVGLPDYQGETLVLVLEQEGQPLALAVDSIVGQQQVVLKSLEENFVRMPGFAGATILGDGRVALILDVAELFRHTQHTELSHVHAA
ncbi:MAG: chemotaxis protein CheW, partial [Fimbriimonadales bacterium]|nr:chemotaxis protein CheW [Fimbriimonadales bacterium]